MTTPESIARLLFPNDEQKRNDKAEELRQVVQYMSDRNSIDYLVELEHKIKFP